MIDLGNLAPQVLESKAKLLEGFDPTATAQSVGDFWLELRGAVQRWDIDFSSLVVYQDALPSAPPEQPGMERLIVQSLAEKRSQNHQLLRWLQDQGARLIGTESIDLLLEEYRLTMALLEADDDSALAGDDGSSPRNREARELLVQRDQYIAGRIDTTLDEDSTGVIFLGLMHAVEPWLAADIETCYPFGKPRGIKIY